MSGTSKAVAFYVQFYRIVKRDPAITTVVSFFIGVISGSVLIRKGIIIAVIVLLVILVIRLGRKLKQENRMNEVERSLIRPNPVALKRVSTENEACLIVGDAIEVLPHSTLQSKSDMSNIGWNPGDVIVDFNKKLFSVDEILSKCGGRKEFDPPSGRKFCLTSRSIGGTDDSLKLAVEETDFFTIQSVRPQVESSSDFRSSWGSLTPSKNRIPHSLCLHFLVRFSDGSLLALHNDPSKAYEGGSWSVSAEEQIKKTDIDDDRPIEHHFRRALLEEVFGLSNDQKPVNKRWEEVEHLVQGLRIYSLFVEERINNFCLLGVCQLVVNCDAFVKWTQSKILEGEYSRDKEGKMYWLPESEVEKLFAEDAGHAIWVFGDSSKLVTGKELHPTSRYRLYRLLKAVGGGIYRGSNT